MAITTKSVLIEVDDDAVGVLVEKTGAKDGYLFHVVHPKLSHLHGSEFASVNAAIHAAKDAMKALQIKAAS
jgi:hypothetical protein